MVVYYCAWADIMLVGLRTWNAALMLGCPYHVEFVDGGQVMPRRLGLKAGLTLRVDSGRATSVAERNPNSQRIRIQE